MSTVVQSVNCYGNETEMLNCPYSTTSGLDTCSEHSAAVICQGKATGLLEYIRQIRSTMHQYEWSKRICIYVRYVNFCMQRLFV